MRAFGIVTILIALLIAVLLVSRDITSRTSDKEEQTKITAIEKAKDAEKQIGQSNETTQKRLKEIHDE